MWTVAIAATGALFTILFYFLVRLSDRIDAVDRHLSNTDSSLATLKERVDTNRERIQKLRD